MTSQIAVRYGLIVGPTAYLGVNGINQENCDGVFYYKSSTRFRDVTDGLTNTLCVGERPPSSDFTWGWWYAGVGSDFGALDHTLGVREISRGAFQRICGTPDPIFTHGSIDSSPCEASHFWSLHPNGANFLFADGSVKFVSYEAVSVLPAIATRSGNEVATTIE